MDNNDPVDTPSIGYCVAAFMHSLQTMGAAQKEWERCPCEGSAARLENAAAAMETAVGMLAVLVPAGADQTRSEVEAWRARRRLFVLGGLLGVVAQADES